ncbi:MAG TPA: hypothetical protein VMM13_11830, partial [Euzebya sp.]|nr:hypothetical protein [Euzebya sp.]
AQAQQLAEPGISLAEMACRYLEVGHTQPDMRISIREKLAQDISGIDVEPDAPELVHLRLRQAAGEIAEQFDPAFVLLLLQAVVVAGFVFPGDIKRYMGMDPDSPEYLAHVGAQLRLLVDRLGGSVEDPDRG